MKQFGLNMENYQKLARQAAAEGCVLLENRPGTPCHWRQQ